MRVVVGVLLWGAEFWFYRWAGAIGFVFGAVVSYVNFRSLPRGFEGLADRIVNRDSREKGGWIILRFLVRYGLVGATAYAIFKSSSLAFRGFLWGLCVPVAALMAEAVWEGYTAFRRASEAPLVGLQGFSSRPEPAFFTLFLLHRLPLPPLSPYHK